MRTIVSRDGTPIAAESLGSGPPLVLVHGTSADRSRWNTVTPALAQSFETLAIDRRGRGDSGDAEAYAGEREFEDVAAAVDAVGPATLLGHSFGAICSLEAATRAEKLTRLILYEPPIGMPVSAQALDRLEALLEDGDRSGTVSTFLSQVALVPDREIALMQSLPAWQARMAAAHTLARELAVVAEYAPDPARIGALGVPVLLLVGGDSPAPMRAASEKLAAMLPDAIVVTLPGQQHVAMDTAPDLVVGAVREFVGAP